MTTEKDQDLLDLQTTDSFRLYLDEVGRHPLLTKEDEIELSQAYEAGLAARAKLKDLGPDDKDRAGLQVTADLGERARRKMIESNLRLVVSIARRFSATGLPLGDLVQEGNLGLLRAVEKFDWRKGFKFSTYATWWIRQAIARGAADRGARAIRLPVHVDEQVGRLRRTQTRLHEVLGGLPERERQVLVLRFGLDSGTPRTLEEVGAIMGFSRERARQVERDALASLRSPEIRARLEDLVAA